MELNCPRGGRRESWAALGVEDGLVGLPLGWKMRERWTDPEVEDGGGGLPLGGRRGKWTAPGVEDEDGGLS